VQISNVSASGVTGRLTASGKMSLKGLAFQSADGEVRIAQKEAIPLTLEGVSVGDAWGTLMLHAKMSDERTVKLDIDVPVFHVDMPESSSRGVQALSEHPDITIGVRKRTELLPVLLAAPEEPRDEDALAWRATFYLGQDVIIRRGSMLQLKVTGQPVVHLTDRAHITGEVDLRGGTVDVFGKRFEIEHGTAEFDGDDPSNPNVSVTARWDAPDGTRIYADFVGRIKTGLFALRSAPARSQSEILSALVFGTTGETAVAPGSSYYRQQKQVNTVGSLAVGSAVTTNVNKVLSSVTPLDITTRMTTDAQSPTPEVAVRLSPKVTAQVSYRTRAPLPTEKQDRMLLTLDWRFLRNWSIASTVGDKGGSSVDLVWKYRY
jgi:translocation and assembly module TamB